MLTNFCSAFVFTLIFQTISIAGSAEVFDPVKCQKGCMNDDNCPQHALCVPVVTTSDCGICVCHDGYTPVRNQCRMEKQTNNNQNRITGNARNVNGNARNVNSNSKLHTPPTIFSVTPASQVFNGAPPSSVAKDSGFPNPEPIDCSAYECGTRSESSIDNQPFKIRTQKLPPQPSVATCKSPLASNAKECRGVYCLDLNNGKSYCICQYNKVGHSCNEDKPGTCSQGTGQISPQAYIKPDVRYKHAGDPDQGSVIARHFAVSVADCIKLCQWTAGRCTSINFGLINGNKVCELLSIKIQNPGILSNWLSNESGWTYACCFDKN